MRRRRPWDVAAALAHPAVVAWAAARVLVFGALGLSRFVTTELGARPPMGRAPVGLLGWDAAWYVAIASEGYDRLPAEARRFFPLFPAVSSLVPGTGARLAALLVANLAALGAGVLLHRLALVETGDRAVAGRAAWFLAVYPAAFVLVMGYAEGLFLVLAIAAFLGLRRRRWWWAAAAGVAAALTRPVGAALALPAAIEAARGWRSVPAGERPARVAAVASPLLGLAGYLAWVELRFGTGLLPLRAHESAALRGGYGDPFTRLAEAAGDLVGGELVGSGLHLPWAVAMLVLLVPTFRRWPASYGAFAAVLVLVALGADNLDSLERYGLSAFPLLLTLAGLARPPWAERAVLVAGAGGLAGYATLAFLGAYVP